MFRRIVCTLLVVFLVAACNGKKEKKNSKRKKKANKISIKTLSKPEVKIKKFQKKENYEASFSYDQAGQEYSHHLTSNHFKISSGGYSRMNDFVSFDAQLKLKTSHFPKKTNINVELKRKANYQEAECTIDLPKPSKIKPGKFVIHNRRTIKIHQYGIVQGGTLSKMHFGSKGLLGKYKYGSKTIYARKSSFKNWKQYLVIASCSPARGIHKNNFERYFKIFDPDQRHFKRLKGQAELDIVGNTAYMCFYGFLHRKIKSRFLFCYFF